MSDIRFEEEEFTTGFSGQTVRRILAQARPHWRWVVGFLACIGLVSAQDSVFTYLSKLIIDEGIMAGDRERLVEVLTIYGVLSIIQVSAVFGFIYMAGILGERISRTKA